MRGKKIGSKVGKKVKDQNLDALLQISNEYQQLLRQLVENNYMGTEQSPQAYLYDTLQNVKQMNTCMKQELKLYNHFCNPVLEQFLQRKQLLNSSNLIGKYESLNDEIEIHQEKIAALQSSNNEEKIYEELAEEERDLQEEMKKLTNRRIELRNKTQMIAYQIQCGETDLNSMKVKIFQEEIKLRKIENQNKTSRK